MFKQLFNKLKGNADARQTDKNTTVEASSPASTEISGRATAEEERQNETTRKTEEQLTYIESAEPAPDTTTEPVDKEELKNRVIDMMRTIFDPEIPVNVYDIGLIYKIEPQDDGVVQLTMTLTTPNCPAAGILPAEVENKARSVDGVRDVEFELTFDPPWTPDLMSEGARLELGMM